MKSGAPLERLTVLQRLDQRCLKQLLDGINVALLLLDLDVSSRVVKPKAPKLFADDVLCFSFVLTHNFLP
jgi:hypothetical protein